jgi:hypothetical protein
MRRRPELTDVEFDAYRRAEEERARGAGRDVLASYDAMREREDARTARLLAQVIAPVESEAGNTGSAPDETAPSLPDDDQALGRALLAEIDRSRHQEE